MMNDQPPIERKKLRWWFWFLLFTPAVFSAVGSTLVGFGGGSEKELGWLISLNFLALPLNGICSACCAVHLSRVRTGQAKAVWLILGTLSFFALNVVLAFGGCAAGTFLSDALDK